jgi:hypothetical protein
VCVFLFTVKYNILQSKILFYNYITNFIFWDYFSENGHKMRAVFLALACTLAVVAAKKDYSIKIKAKTVGTPTVLEVRPCPCFVGRSCHCRVARQ